MKRLICIVALGFGFLVSSCAQLETESQNQAGGGVDNAIFTEIVSVFKVIFEINGVYPIGWSRIDELPNPNSFIFGYHRLLGLRSISSIDQPSGTYFNIYFHAGPSDSLALPQYCGTPFNPSSTEESSGSPRESDTSSISSNEDEALEGISGSLGTGTGNGLLQRRNLYLCQTPFTGSFSIQKTLVKRISNLTFPGLAEPWTFHFGVITNMSNNAMLPVLDSLSAAIVGLTEEQGSNDQEQDSSPSIQGSTVFVPNAASNAGPISNP